MSRRRFRPAFESLEDRSVPATHLVLSGFASGATAGVTGQVTVTAANADGSTDTAYGGAIHFASSDAKAVLPANTTLANGTGTFNVTFKTSGRQTLTCVDTENSSINGGLAASGQIVAYTQAPNSAGGHDKSAWYPPDGLDGDQYVWDSFVLPADKSITEIDWRGCYTNYLSGAGESPVYDFDVAIYASIAGGIQPDVINPPLVHYLVGGNANETLSDTLGNIPTYTYSYALPNPFQATGGTKYWVQIVARQGLTPFYYWPPDWSLSYGTGGDSSHFREIIGGSLAGGNAFQTVANDVAFTLMTPASLPGVVVDPAATSRLIVSGMPSPATAGVPGKLTVTAQDQFGNVTPAFTDLVRVTSSDAKAALPSDAILTNGIGTFDVTLKTVAVQSITATDVADGTIKGTQSGISVDPAAAAKFTVAGFPSPTVTGVGHNFTVTAFDAFDNVATGYVGTVRFTSTDAAAGLPAAYPFQPGDAGSHVFTAAMNTVGTWSLDAVDSVDSAVMGQQTNVEAIAPVTLSGLSFTQWTDNRGGYSGTVTIAGGKGAYSLTNLTGLPTGLRAGLTGNVISFGGTPSTAGTFTILVSVSDAIGTLASQNYVFTVFPSTTVAWTGLGGDNLWTNASNWTGAAPATGTTLIFSTGAPQKSNVNDFPANTLFTSLVFQDAGYVLTGNAIKLAKGVAASESGVGSDAIALNVNLTANQTWTIDGVGETLTVTGVISGKGFGITKAGLGMLSFGGASGNTYSGVTTVNNGTLELDKSSGNAVSGPLTINTGKVVYGALGNQILDTSAVTVWSAGVLDLGGRDEKIGALTLIGGTVTTDTGTLTLGGNVTTKASASSALIDGNLNLGGVARTFTVADGDATEDLEIAATISNGGITKAGTGALELSGTNSYVGQTTIKAGVLDARNSSALGTAAGSTVVNAGATLELELETNQIFAESLKLGTANGKGGTLLMLGGSNTWAGTVSLAATSTVNVGSGTLTLSGVISGTGGINKAGPGTLVFAGGAGNVYKGKTTITGGELQLAKQLGNAIAASLVVGAGARATYLNGNQIAETSAVTVGAGAIFDLHDQEDEIGALTITGGSVTTGTGTLTLRGDVTSNASTTMATITGNLDLAGRTMKITVAEGVADPDLTITGVILNGSLQKAGLGKLVVNGIIM